jgi:ABC-2 type transport system ATP-binding protein
VNGRAAHRPASGIVADRLRVSYRDRQVLSSVSFQVPVGTVYGLLGQNGAGKTTTLNVMAGLIHPDAGRAWLGPHSLLDSPLPAKHALGFVPDDPVLFGTLTGAEHLELVLDLRADPAGRASRTARIEEVLGLTGLLPDAGRFVGQYSRGMRQRLVIGMALVGRPAYLVLDEPASGLDPTGLARLKRLLRGMAETGCAALLASHQLDVVRGVCDRVGILHDGRIAAEYPVPSVGLDLERAFLSVTAGTDQPW